MHGRQRDIGLANVALGELSRQTGGLPEVASGDAVPDLEGRLADHFIPHLSVFALVRSSG